MNGKSFKVKLFSPCKLPLELDPRMVCFHDSNDIENVGINNSNSATTSVTSFSRTQPGFSGMFCDLSTTRTTA